MPEAIVWAHKAAALRQIRARRFSAESNKMEDVFDDETGQPVYERIPQRAHVGGDYDNPIASKNARWIHVLRHDGHVTRCVLTGSAADLDMDAPQGREIRAKARHFGWIEVGHCPLADIAAGALNKGQLIAKDVREMSERDACTRGSYGPANPCKHYVAEEAARKGLQARKQAAADKARQSDAEKIITSQGDQTKAIVTGVAEAVSLGVAEALRAKDKK